MARSWTTLEGVMRNGEGSEVMEMALQIVKQDGTVALCYVFCRVI
jgi:hypothetical protein